MSFLTPSERTLFETIGSYMYIGTAPSNSTISDPVWQIIRLTFTAGAVSAIEWADGNQSYDNKWTERLTKSYS